MKTGPLADYLRETELGVLLPDLPASTSQPEPPPFAPPAPPVRKFSPSSLHFETALPFWEPKRGQSSVASRVFAFLRLHESPAQLAVWTGSRTRECG